MAGDLSILVAGATGLVGRACLQRLLDEPAFNSIVVLTRRALPSDIHERAGDRLEERRIDFDRLDSEEYRDHFDVDQILCCLGTTIKKAGSQERFREVDFGYPKIIAERAAARGARHFLLVSALGASSESRIFYNRVKGDLEEAILDMPFRSVTIVRPSLLLGDRGEFRLGEEIATRLRFLIPKKFRPVHADDVAKVLVDAAKRDDAGKRIIESAEIRKLAASRRG